jgi:hypothetical protein
MIEAEDRGEVRLVAMTQERLDDLSITVDTDAIWENGITEDEMRGAAVAVGAEVARLGLDEKNGAYRAYVKLRALSDTEEPSDGKITEWVNARIEILVPLNISPDATDSEKIEAAEEAYLDLGLPEDLPVHITWEDAS